MEGLLAAFALCGTQMSEKAEESSLACASSVLQRVSVKESQ